MLTINTPVHADGEVVERFIKGNERILNKFPLIVVSRGTGDQLKSIAKLFFTQLTSLGFARRFGLEHVDTQYVLNLDVDTILPFDYVIQAVNLMEGNLKVGAVAIDYQELQGHLAFGTSVWHTTLMKQLYDWNLTSNKQGGCECLSMWSKLRRNGYLLESLNYRATHIKGENLG